MTRRTFPETTVATDAGAVKAMTIRCVECGAVAHFQCVKAGTRYPATAAVQHFQRKGWSVGSKARKDLCPNHVHPKKEIAPVANPNAPKAAESPKAEPPREMTREDRRIINDRLDEVYGKECYKTPWTDQSVAKDLGVPQKWVADVRETFFGPAGSNPQIEEFLSKHQAFSDAVKSFHASCEDCKRVLSTLETWRENIIKHADELNRIGRNIEKALGR